MCSRSTILQSLQYQITHRYYPCGYNLHLWKIQDTNTCKYCQEIDTVQHSLVECAATKQFWQNLNIWYNAFFETIINFGHLDILFGIPKHNCNNEIDQVNFIILLAKKYIKEKRCFIKEIDFDSFKLEIKEGLQIEKQILLKNGKIEKFKKKWNKLAEALGTLS